MYEIILKCMEDAFALHLECEEGELKEHYIEDILKPLEAILENLTEKHTKEVIKAMKEVGASSPMSLLNEVYEEIIMKYEEESENDNI